ncbi:MAG: CBS domain-containing protein [Verrucomicrobiaceae bacterium]|nr:MAG: CBS domain-containing protein [Verrucomicrobiaceae bacterium]
MKTQEIMTLEVEVIRPTDTLFEAAKKMRDLDIGVLPVCFDNRLQGMITDRDITIRAVAEGRDPSSMLVQDVMSPDVIYCYEDDNLEHVEQMMMDYQVRRLPVVTRKNKRLAGIISIGDLATKSGEVQEIGRTLREISEPAHL